MKNQQFTSIRQQRMNGKCTMSLLQLEFLQKEGKQ
jgi:hypothetical protein